MAMIKSRRSPVKGSGVVILEKIQGTFVLDALDIFPHDNVGIELTALQMYNA